MNFTPVHSGLMKYILDKTDRSQPPKDYHNQVSTTLNVHERRKKFFDTVGNDWYCSLSEFETYVQSGEPSNLSIFIKGTKAFENEELRCSYQYQDQSTHRSQEEIQKLENAYFDRLIREYDEEHSYFSKYNDLSDAKEKEFIVDDSNLVPESPTDFN